MKQYYISEEEYIILHKAYDIINRLNDETADEGKQFELLRAGLTLLSVMLDSEVEE